MKIESLDHIHIYCGDAEQSAAFYRQHFDAAEVHRSQNVYDQTRIFLQLGGQLVVLGPFPPEMASSTPPTAIDGAYGHGFGVAHFGLRVLDVKAAVEELKEAGIEILSEPVLEDTGLSYAYVAAPDGVVVELTQYGRPSQ
jgi:lactoylglutathione lyase